MVAPHYAQVIALPPNKCMELIVLLGTPLAKRRARAAPSKPAAHAGRSAAQNPQYRRPSMSGRELRFESASSTQTLTEALAEYYAANPGLL
jgi:hypothetical protein